MAVTYTRETSLTAAEFAALLAETTMAPKRPLQNLERIERMLRGANFIVTARDESGALLGVARCITDFEWICYCAELAVRQSHQGQGIGKSILAEAKQLLGPGICLTLNSEPEAIAFYEHIGMQPYQAFFIPRENRD